MCLLQCAFKHVFCFQPTTCARLNVYLNNSLQLWMPFVCIHFERVNCYIAGTEYHNFSFMVMMPFITW